MQTSLFTAREYGEVDYAMLEEAWYSCIKKKKKNQALKDFASCKEEELLKLCAEINSRSYAPSPSIAFIVDKPVVREVFAAPLRDRVVHHLLINELDSFFERNFIYDSYACRKGKGILFGIKRVQSFMAKCSKGYTQDAYVLKLDIQAFFMSINKDILFEKLRSFILKQPIDKAYAKLLIWLCEQTIADRPQHNCEIRGHQSKWGKLPTHKSLFYAKENCGLAIGNLTSQIFANFYMNEFDHHIKHELGIAYYGRYVDDCVFVHSDQKYLASLIPYFESYLYNELGLTLHPKKRSLQHYSKGVEFLGGYILPQRIYAGKRCKGNFYACISQSNQLVRQRKPSPDEISNYQSKFNSYLGHLKHFASYRLRRKMITENLSGYWFNHLYSSGGCQKLVRR